MSEETKKPAEPKVELSLSALKEILAEQSRQNAEQLKTVIEELRKPTVLEQKELDKAAKELEAKNEERKSNAASMIQKIENQRVNQRICSHKHRNTGQSHCVLITERAGTQYLLCQLNQCKIRPGTAPADYKGNDIYDTATFNRVLQEMPSNEMFG